MNVEQASSSSDEEQKLREALDVRMFNVAKPIPGRNSEDGKRVRATFDRFKNKTLNVTPEFQNFVAKHLSDTLDRIIEECEPAKYHIEPNQSAGIRLFTDSKTLLLDKEFLHTHDACDIESKVSVSRSKQRSKRKMKETLAKRDPNELHEKLKCRDAAISAEWILSGESTKGWSRPKGEVFAYRKNRNGILEMVESSVNVFS